MVARKISRSTKKGSETSASAEDGGQIIEGTATEIEAEVADAPVEESVSENENPEPEAADAPTEAEAAPETAEPEVEPAEAERPAEPAPEETPAAPAMVPAPEPAHRGPGFVPLVLGGVVAAGIGYGAAVFGLLPVPGNGQDIEALAGISTQLESQSAALTTLNDRAGALETSVAGLPDATSADPVDLSPLTERLDAVAAQITATDATITTLANRITALEARPVATGDGTGDNGQAAAAMAAAVAQLEASLQTQQDENASMAAEIRALATDAETRISAAEARAEARVGTATAQAALGQLRIAVATGTPFAGALADVAAGTDVAVPEALQAAAASGVPMLDELQNAFPALARAALPLALRETAGETTMDRLGAFLRGQVGGRSLEPQEGDDPDAVLSRAEASLRTGDLAAVLDTLTALPDPALALFADWSAAARTRLAATDALDSFAAALDGAN